MDNLDPLVLQQNPQWQDPSYQPKEVGLFVRPQTSQLNSWLNQRPIISVTGLRRVGKSTLLRQTYAKLIPGSPFHTLYFSFEKSLSKKPQYLRQLINQYSSLVL